MHLIYPMLAGRCKGKKELGGKIKYIYGPCKNFERDEKGLPVCTIHENKPKMCSGYPHYGSAQVITMNVEGKVNPAWHRGCGYNADPSYGGTNETLILGVQPLAKDEE
jgi:Fe-S-cluster containining protein